MDLYFGRVITHLVLRHTGTYHPTNGAQQVLLGSCLPITAPSGLNIYIHTRLPSNRASLTKVNDGKQRLAILI